MSVITKIADILEGNIQVLTKGTNLFLGKTLDISVDNSVMLSEEADIGVQEVVFNSERSANEKTIITCRVIYGSTYSSSDSLATEIYDLFRNQRNWSDKSILAVDPTKPIFTQKIKGGEKFQFAMMLNVEYLTS